MTIEINIDGARKQQNESNMESNENLDFLRKRQLANEMRYSIGESISGDKHDLIFDNNIENAKLKQFVELNFGIENNFNRLVKPYVEEFKNKLIAQWNISRPKNWDSTEIDTNPPNDSWNTIMMWDCKVKCPGEGCQDYILKTPASNDVKLWKKARDVTSSITKSSEIFSLKNRTIDMQLLRSEINNIHKFIDCDLSSKFAEKELRKMQKEDITTYNSMLYANLCLDELDRCKSCGKDLFAHTPTINKNNKFFETIADLTIKKIVATIAGSVISTSSKNYIGRIDNFQLPKQNQSISQDIRELMVKLAELSSEINELHEKREESDIDYKINTQDKLNALDDSINQTKSIMMSKLLNGELDTQLHALVELGITHKKLHKPLFDESKNRIKGMVSFSAGKISDYNFQTKRHSGILSSCIQQGLNFGDVTINRLNGSRIIIKQADNLSVDQLQVTSAKLIDGIANELTKLKPMAFFSGQKTEFPAASQTKWAKKIAVQLLYIIKEIDNFLTFRKVHQDELNSTDKTFQHKIWLIKYSKHFKSEFIAAFTENEFDSPEEILYFFNTMRFEPMLCPPENRTESLSSGGYLTESARRKSQLISNNLPEHNFNITRFNPSNIAIDNINKLQQTSWRINGSVAEVVNHCLKSRVSEFFDKIEFSSEHYGIVANYVDDFPEFDGGQLIEWMESLDLAGWLMEQSVDKFWHAWRFDWRGRMYPCSTLLTPQGDDVSRGLLLFGDALPLNNEGWKWLKRMIGRAYRGREICLKEEIENGESKVINNNGFSNKEIETWSEIQNNLKTKKWSDIDKVFDGIEQESLIEKVIQKIALDPNGTQSIWAKNDIFVKKAEGFQRLALTLEYHSVIEQRKSTSNKTILSSIPFVVDASSNIYQHASRLTGDDEMAKSVNVLPNENRIPADVYKKVANEVANLIEMQKPFSSLSLTDKELETIKSFCISRDTAKGPVMTIGYGATDYSMIPKFLTHNGETNGIVTWVYVDLTNNQIISSRDYFQNKEHLLNIPMKNLDNIKSEISKEEYKQRKQTLEQNFKLLFMSNMAAHPVSKFGKAIKHSNIMTLMEKKIHHHQIASIISELFKKAIDIVLPGHSRLKESLELVRKVNSSFLEKTENYTQWSTVDDCLICNIRFHKNKPSPVIPWKKSQTTGGKVPTRDDVTLTFSANIPNEKRNPDDEKTGLPPNFVHSIDATHMRLFVNKISSLTPNIWSVHDAFGVHPNFGDSLLRYGTETFFEAHYCKTAGSKLHEVIENSLDLVLETRETSIAPKATKSVVNEVTNLKNIAGEFSSSKDNVDIIKLGSIKKDYLEQEGKIEYKNIDDLLVINYDELYLLS
jgi:hypothetical protein